MGVDKNSKRRATATRASEAARVLRQQMRRWTALEQQGELAQALREVDRAWRTQPERRGQLAPVLGRLLLRDGQSPAAALNVLARAVELDGSASNEAQLIHALFETGYAEAALQRLTKALGLYASDAKGPLLQAARVIAAARPDALRGWVALTENMAFWLECRASSETADIEVLAADGSSLVRKRLRAGRDGWVRGRVPLPQPSEVQFLRVLADGQALPGGERILPLDFRLRARSSALGRKVECQAQLAWSPQQELALELQDERGRVLRVQTRSGRWTGDADRLKLGGRVEVRAVLPDGRLVEFPDSPLLFAPELKAQLQVLERRRSGLPGARLQRRPPVDVIIPVYQGHQETLACIESVLRTAAVQVANILVVDDASPDAALAADLDALAASGQIILMRNERNLGFSATINRAMAVNPAHDAVLINADALVFGDWLQRLQAAAYRQPQTATVTPFSDDDSVAHYGEGRARSGTPALAEALDAYAREAHRGQSVELPVGVGFCMYLRRAAWCEVGELDAAVFGKGYGEESDWCARARKRGWQHRLAADVFVHHAGGSSFGERRAALLRRADRLMELRHPGYHRRVQAFLKDDPLQGYRRSFDMHRLQCQSRPVVLLVMLGLTGGVDRYVGERCRALRDEGKFPLLLRPAESGRESRPDACRLWSFDPKLTHLSFEIPGELRVLRELLKSLPISSVEFHHFLGLDSKVVKLALGLGVPYTAYLHDYSWICPRITLIDHRGRYCGEPDLASCERCVQRNGSELTEEISVARLRQRSRRWLQGAEQRIAPSQDLAGRLARYVPDIAIAVEPLEAPIVVPPRPTARRQGRVRVALMGALGLHKGYRVLLQCARDAVRRRLNLEFVLIGFSENDRQLQETGRVFVTGEYQDGEVPGLLGREQPDLIWLPSVWPETWCYTLSHALASGLPTVAFDIGAIAERMRQQGAGVLLPLGMKPQQVNDRLLQAARPTNDEQPLFAD